MAPKAQIEAADAECTGPRRREEIGSRWRLPLSTPKLRSPQSPPSPDPNCASKKQNAQPKLGVPTVQQ
jgi:hypothetical protein